MDILRMMVVIYLGLVGTLLLLLGLTVRKEYKKERWIMITIGSVIVGYSIMSYLLTNN